MPSVRCLCVIAFVLLVPASVSADTLRILADAQVHLRPDASSEVLSVLKAGTVIAAAARQGDWYPVLLPPDGRGLRRYGYIAARLVEAGGGERPDAPARILIRKGASLDVFVDAAIAEHITDRVSRMDLARNRALGELLEREAGGRLRRKGLHVKEAGFTSVGLYFEGSSVLRVMRNAEAEGPLLRVHYDDTRWQFDGHEYRVDERTREPGDAAARERDGPPFSVSPVLSATPDRMTRLRDLYRGLDATERLHPMGTRRSRKWQHAVPAAGGLAGTLAGDVALVVLVRGRDRPNPAAVPRIFRDALFDARYEVSGALVSVFMVHAGYARLVAWDSRIEGTTTAAKIREVVGKLVDTVVKRSSGA